MNRSILASLLIVISLGLFSACTDSHLKPTQTWLDIYMEDAPADYLEVKIAVANAQIYNGQEWIKLSVDRKVHNLLSLTGGKNAQIVSQPIEPGHYTKFRVWFSESGGKIKTFKKEYAMPLADPTASLEMEMDLKVQPDEFNYIYFDVNAAKSVIEENDSTFSFRPVGRMVNPFESGAVSGYICTVEDIPIAETMLVNILQGDTVITSTYTNAERGNFFVRIPAGVYALQVVPGSGSLFKQPKPLTDLQIVTGEALRVDGIPLLKSK